MGEKLHNPVLNGSTKKIIMVCVGFLGAGGLLMLLGFFTILILDATSGNSTFHWRTETIIGAMNTVCLGSLGYAVHKFMDTRSSQEKDQYRLAKYEIKMKNKSEKMKYLKQLKEDNAIKNKDKKLN